MIIQGKVADCLDLVGLIFSIFAVMSFVWCFVYTVVDIVIIFYAIKAYRVLRRRMDME